MTHSEELSHWEAEINRHLPSLSKPQAGALALWSVGMMLASSASLNKVALRVHVFLSETGRQFSAFRQRLRDWYLPAQRKAGCKRADWQPDDVFADLVSWVLSLLPEARLILALDATTLRANVTILCVSILISGCAVPVAWRCVAGNEEGKWNPHWLALLQTISSAFAPETEIVVLADRGIWSPLLFLSIIDRGWHPLMRINAGEEVTSAKFRQEGEGQTWRHLPSFAPARGQEVSSQGEAFVSHPIPCTLMIYWGETAREPWYLLTDSPALTNLKGSLYAERMWIEHQFKTIKSDGWHAEKSRIVDPDRVARMWLAYAVGMLWALSVGSQPVIGYDDKEVHHAVQGEARSEDETCEPEQPMEPRAPGKTRKARPEIQSELSQPRLDSETTIECFESVRRTISWFAKGIVVLADRINRAVELNCPRFYYPARCTQLRKC